MASATITAAVVRQARDLIADAARWCIEEYALDSGGDYVDPTDPAACRWCAVGAVIKATGCKPSLNIDFLLDDLLETATGQRCLAAINDSEDDDAHRATLAAMDAIAAQLERREAAR